MSSASPMLPALNVMLVDDEPAILHALLRTLRRGAAQPGWPPLLFETFTDPHRALARAAEQAFILVISDYRMPAMNGSQFLAAMRDLQPHCGRLMLSAHADFEGLIHAINSARIARFLFKPWHEGELLEAVQEQLVESRLQREAALLMERQQLELGVLSPQEVECRRLERMEPGITQVQWSSDGAYVIDPLAIEALRS